MKRRNRNLAVFMSAVMAGTLLAGCGGQKNKEQTQAQTKEEKKRSVGGEKVERSWWSRGIDYVIRSDFYKSSRQNKFTSKPTKYILKQT